MVEWLPVVGSRDFVVANMHIFCIHVENGIHYKNAVKVLNRNSHQ